MVHHYKLHSISEGTVVRKATSDASESSLDVFLWIDAERVEYLPEQGYALIKEGSIVVVATNEKITIGVELMDDHQGGLGRTMPPTLPRSVVLINTKKKGMLNHRRLEGTHREEEARQ